MRFVSKSASMASGLVLAAFLAGCSQETTTTSTSETTTTETIANAQDIHGVWWTVEARNTLSPSDGSAIPYTPEGKAAHDKNIAELKSGAQTDEARKHCTPDGLPRILGAPFPIQIIQTPGQVTIVHEVNHLFRLAFLDKQHPSADDALPFFMGDAVAKWEGDTLVVDTTNFNDKTYLDGTGLPHSDKLHIVERIRLINGGKQLEDVVTIEDPAMFTKSWQVRYVFDRRTDVRMEEFVCGEANRDVSAVKRAP